MTIFALHGFLGLPSDWNFVPKRHAVKMHAVDVFAIHPPKEGLWRWAEVFNAYAERACPQGRILLGYSMGARLAMHALLKAPHLWQGAIFVSGHPGMKTKDERDKKEKEDKRWADRFLKEPWEPLMDDWNHQPIFQQNTSIPRREQDYARPLLAETFVSFSQSKQEELTVRLDACPVPQLWLAGESDAKYAAIARARPSSCIIAEAGHRVPWDNPSLFTKHLIDFLEERNYAPAGNDLAGNQKV